MNILRRIVNMLRMAPVNNTIRYLREQEIASNTAADVIERRSNRPRMNPMERELLGGKSR